MLRNAELARAAMLLVGQDLGEPLSGRAIGMRNPLITGLLSLAWATSVHAIDTTYNGKDLKNMSPSEVERVLGRGKQEASQESGLCPNRKMDIWLFPGGPGKIVRAGFCAQKGLVSLVARDGVLALPTSKLPKARTVYEGTDVRGKWPYEIRYLFGVDPISLPDAGTDLCSLGKMYVVAFKVYDRNAGRERFVKVGFCQQEDETPGAVAVF